MNQPIIRRSVGSILDANQYTLIDGLHAMVIDACTVAEKNIPEDVMVDLVFLTHEHYDHISYANEYREKYGCPVWCGSGAADGLRNSKMNMSHYGFALFEAIGTVAIEEDKIADYVCIADRTFKNQEKFIWNEITFTVLETPGHSPGSVSLLMGSAALFSGDTLLKEEATGIRFRGANKRVLQEKTFPSLQKIDRNLLVYPGHGDTFYLRDYRFWERTT